MSLITIDDVMKNSLTHSEKAVVDYINNHGKIVVELSITELAERAFTSSATVSRAIRKCGFSGVPELRRYLAIKMSQFEAPFIMNEVLEMSYRECTDTIENLSISDVLEIVEIIKKSSKIYILARGITALTAEEFGFQLQLQKFNVQMITDSEIMKRFDKLIEPRDLLIIFTAFNSTPEFAVAAQKAKRIGCSIVTCCCKENTELEKISDFTLVGRNSQIAEMNSFNNASRLPLQIMSRTIIEYLAR